MSTILAWIIVFAIICGCIVFWVYMLHRGPHADEDESSGLPSCDGNCFSCAKNFSGNMTPDNCDDADAEMINEIMNMR